jgi:hypothetical protein
MSHTPAIQVNVAPDVISNGASANQQVVPRNTGTHLTHTLYGAFFLARAFATFL